jgi:hypothetical protein
MNSLKRILRVDDSPRDTELVLNALHNLANEVIALRDGAEALDYLGCAGTSSTSRILRSKSIVPNGLLTNGIFSSEIPWRTMTSSV